MSKKMDSIQHNIINKFSSLDDWFDKYEYVINQGKNFEGMDEEFRSNEHSIGGCQSDVWIKSERKNGVIHFSAHSDSLLVKGMISLILEVVNDQPPTDIVDAEFYFIDAIGLNTHLSPSRLNGLNSIIKQIKTDAKEYADDIMKS
jgi:cysteine desulfuration protein SufE